MTWTAVAETLLKTLAGGALVLLFALVSEVVRPKPLAGTFATAPAVALAGLAISGLFKGQHEVHMAAAGMVAGGAGMFAYTLLVPVLHRRRDALASASLALTAWFVVAAFFYFLIVR
jgi:uncharacterized membrane protein (GlpM family)